jgi:hypothetical protein
MAKMLRCPLLLAALFATPAYATTFLQQPFPEAVGEAPIVVRGHIGNSFSDWATADGQKRIYTFYELGVSEVFKGPVPPAAKTLAIRELGGTKGGVGMQVAGTAHFDQGEDVVVFLNPKNPDGTYDMRGMMMGKFNIKQDANGKEYLAGPGLIEKQGNGILNDDALDRAQGGTGVNTTWTPERLRQLIDDQRSGRPAPESSPIPKASPVASPVASPAPARPAASPSAAPTLQPTEPEEAGSPSGVWSRVGLPFTIVALLIGAAALLRRRRK